MKGPEEGEQHPHFIIKQLKDGSYVTTNFSSTKDKRAYDTTCVFTPEDEPCLKMRSFVVYSECQHIDLNKWTKGHYEILGHLRPENCQQIAEGALKSDYTPNDIKALLRGG